MAGHVDVSAEVEGLKNLRRTIRQAGGDTKDLRNANLAAAQTIVPIAAGLAPKVSGRLAASIRAGATQKAGMVRAGRKLIPYANPVHWGWPKRHIAPNPWIATAAAANEELWLKVYEQHIDRILGKIEGKKR